MLSGNFTTILRTLTAHQVQFVLVGGLSAIVNGAPVNTFDVDVVHSRKPENLERMLEALKELEAWYRLRTDKKILPGISYFAGGGHILLNTTHGPLDVLGSIGGLDYEGLLPDTSLLKVAPEVIVRTLNLDKYIELKEKLDRDKDRATLPTLRATLDEINRQRKKSNQSDAI